MTLEVVFRHDAGEVVFNSLDLARNYFGNLTTGPDPLSLNGRGFPGLPDRHIPLDEIRDLLLTRSCPQTTRDAVWARLVELAREQGAT